jgi:hypothetical protein
MHDVLLLLGFACSASRGEIRDKIKDGGRKLIDIDDEKMYD